MTLDRYADLFDDDLDEVADRLDEVGRKAGVAILLPRGEIARLADAGRKAEGQ